MYEKTVIVKRTVWVAECKCGHKDIRVHNPPREVHCKCGEWVQFKEESYQGPDFEIK